MLNTEKFILKAKEIHGDKYDYSLVKYVNSYTKVIIICKIHGKFEQTPASHIHGKSGCPNCKIVKQTLTKEQFISKAKKVHGDKYDYFFVKYVNNKKKIPITCPIHGEFEQKPTKHMYEKNGCPKCGVVARTLTTEEFIANAKEVHGDKYDYSLVKYVNNKKKVTIICPIHGEFEILPNNHISGKHGCLKCAVVEQTLTSEEFIAEAKKVHGDKYDYSLVKYVNSNTKVIIICSIHGEFEQKPDNHIHEKNGCPKCGVCARTLTTEEFISMANDVHDDIYDYSLTEYVNSHTKVIIKCLIHDNFYQNPSSHLSGCGCPKCKAKKGERAINKWLSKHNIIFTPQHIFYGCKYKHVLRFDFYLPKLNMCIEYDGEHHFRPVKFSSKMSDEQARKNFKSTKLRDKLKNEYCDRNNIRMVRVPYKVLERIDDVLNMKVR